ncbi:MAG: helix-turn-helix domain-containing protein [Rikenellaceae bacterium]|nr:helix-turn-helix domain-containing protein [Rikenellaceae bacterium]
MENKNYTQTIKTLRQRRGFSQEELAEKAGLSLRTIQRIENGETEARGDSLKRIAAALGVTPNEIIDWTMQENPPYLSYLNLSALAFMVMSFLGILLPFVL